MIPYRHHHLIEVLEIFEDSTLPLDRVIHDYFRSNKALGSKDRAYIADAAFAMIRSKGLLDYYCQHPRWESRLETYLEGFEVDPSLPAYIRHSFPKDLYDLIEESWGPQTEEICAISNTQAPTTLRVNTLKTDRESLMKRIPDAVASKNTDTAIHLKKRTALFSLPEFEQGLFEVQDEASQRIAALVQVKPGDHVLDYCAGAGGKTLAFAPAMQNKGQIYLHDIRPAILLEAKKRLKRAGIQNVQFLTSDKLNPIKKKCDWVLVDVPCTGTGTLRRNPDMKLRITPEMLKRLVGEQRHIFEKGLSFLKPGGKIVYATCSILKQENIDQIKHFQQTYNLKLETEPLQIMPTEGGMDGFFGAVLSKNPTS